MSKRSRADSHLEAINSVFERLFAITNTSKGADYVTLGILKKLKHQALSAAAEEEEFTRMAATEFTLDEQFRPSPDVQLQTERERKTLVEIDVLPDVETFQPSACLSKVSP